MRKGDNGIFFNTELPPYRYGLVVSIGQSDASIKRDLARIDKKFKVERTADVMLALKNRTPGFCVMWEADAFMFIEKMPLLVKDQGVVVHELLHIVRHCMRSRGIRMNNHSTEEAHCYLMEDLWNEVMSRVARHIRKR